MAPGENAGCGVDLQPHPEPAPDGRSAGHHDGHQPSRGDVELAVIGLTKRYGRTPALDGVTVTFGIGLTGLLGPNAAGKSTLMRCVAAVENWDRGSVRMTVAGEDRPARESIGFLPESVAFPRELRLRSFLRLVCSAKGVGQRWRQEVDAKLAVTGLAQVADRVIGTLSKGYRQRLGLAQAMIGDPPVLILDEPASSLDPMTLLEIRGAIRSVARSACVVVSTHQLAEAEALCDRVVLLDRGRIAFDGTISALGRQHQRTFDIKMLGPAAGETHTETVTVADDDELAERIAGLVSAGGRVIGVRPVRDALEMAFADAVAKATSRRVVEEGR